MVGTTQLKHRLLVNWDMSPHSKFVCNPRTTWNTLTDSTDTIQIYSNDLRIFLPVSFVQMKRKANSGHRSNTCIIYTYIIIIIIIDQYDHVCFQKSCNSKMDLDGFCAGVFSKSVVYTTIKCPISQFPSFCRIEMSIESHAGMSQKLSDSATSVSPFPYHPCMVYIYLHFVIFF